MKIFISGAAGFLGSHLAEAFLVDGHSVVGCDNMIGGDLHNVHGEVDFHQVDCNQIDTMKRLTEGCDVVYHCAATAYEGLSVFSPHLVTQNTVGASVSLFSAAIANRVKRIVFCFVAQGDRRCLATHLGAAVARDHELRHQAFCIPTFNRVKARLLTVGELDRQ